MASHKLRETVVNVRQKNMGLQMQHLRDLADNTELKRDKAELKRDKAELKR